MLRLVPNTPAPVVTSYPHLSAKDTARCIRKVLRAAFPACRFSVVTERGSMVSAVRISWTDGPSEKSVEREVSGFEAGRFDGMTDSYDYDDTTFVEVDGVMYRPGCKYVFTSRKTSPTFVLRVARAVLAYRWEWETGHEARAEATVEALANATTDAGAAAFWGAAWNIRLARNDTNLATLVHRAICDRTTTLHTVEG